MRLVVIKSMDPVTTVSYSCYILQLLEEVLFERGYKIIQAGTRFPDRNTITKDPDQLIVLTIPEELSLGLSWWLDIQLPLFIKKFHAEKAIFLNGLTSKTLKIPQLMVISDISYLKTKKNTREKWQIHSRRNIRKYLEKARLVLTYTEQAKTFLVNEFGAGDEKIRVLYRSKSPHLQNVKNITEKTGIRQKYSKGREYFLLLHDGTMNDLLPVLKSFSVFKKWQKSNMMLLISSNLESEDPAFTAKLSTYRYREDVELIHDPAHQLHQELMSAAYAVICFYKTEGHLKYIIESMQSEVPVLTTKLPGIMELCGEAAMYMEEPIPEKLGKQLIEIFKQEDYRGKLIQKGLLALKKYDYRKAREEIGAILSEN